jgi:hypothetical protein
MTPLISTLETPLQCTEKPARLTYASCVCPSAFRSKETWTKLPTDRSTGRSASVVQNIQTVRCSKLHARSTHINGGSYTRNDGTQADAHTCAGQGTCGGGLPRISSGGARVVGGRLCWLARVSRSLSPHLQRPSSVFRPELALCSASQEFRVLAHISSSVDILPHH